MEEKNYRKSWFKFYGQDWLTDMKIITMPLWDKLCYLTILCLASQNNGVVTSCNEDVILKLSGIEQDPTDDNETYQKAKGCIDRFVELGCVTKSNESNATLHFVLHVVNWSKRQDTNLTNAERQAKYRNRKSMPINKDKIKVTKSNAPRNESNVREEKRREEKRREDTTPFEGFWNIYPNKTEKKKAQEKWLKIPLEVQKKILDDIPRRILGEKWSKDNGRYIEMPTTYLNGERWNDEIKTKKDSGSYQVVDFTKK